MNAELITKLDYRQELREMLLGFRKSRVLISCVELGLFEALDGKQLSAAQLAAQLGCSERGMAILANAAVALGLLEKHQGLYRNVKAADACLACEGPFYMGNLVRLEIDFSRRWGYLTTAVRSGHRPNEDARRTDPEWVRIFELAHVDMARDLAPVIAEALDLPRDRPLRSIDLGGGHGYYSLALAECYPNLTATVFDLPHVTPLTRELVGKSAIRDRMIVQTGNFLVDELGSGYDLALLFGVMGGQNPQNREKLIARTFAALKPGGKLVLHDSALDPDRTQPEDAALFAAWMLIATDDGGVSTRDDFAAWIQKAGFGPIKMLPLPKWTEEPLLIAEKSLH